MIEARVYVTDPETEQGDYLGEHRFLAVPRPGDHLSIWRKLELLRLVVVCVGHHASPVDPRDEGSDPLGEPGISITTHRAQVYSD